MKRVLLLFVITVVLSSCGSSSFEIVGKSVCLTELNDKELSVFNEDNPPMMVFDKGRVSATVGCNSIFAVYQTGKNNTITLSEGGSTRMMCPEESREDEFIKAFNSIASYSVAGDVVCFKDKNEVVVLKGLLKR